MIWIQVYLLLLFTLKITITLIFFPVELAIFQSTPVGEVVLGRLSNACSSWSMWSTDWNETLFCCNCIVIRTVVLLNIPYIFFQWKIIQWIWFSCILIDRLLEDYRFRDVFPEIKESQAFAGPMSSFILTFIHILHRTVETNSIASLSGKLNANDR